ncbi:MAG: sigma-70 family RNA polymerase sigma factor [Planctomycetota bacterium]|nr:sigma-70 family RNA polymerase sigma factor [Planctomycetota bacterium]MDA1140600.1 sigma-70 family RNA polymerase sigma factor [Planctomycetota bacterium]
MVTGSTNIDPTYWVENHADYLNGYAMLRLRKPEIAEELVQETFLAALRARNNFSGNSSIRTWLVGILKHKIIDYFRSKRRVRPLTDYETEDRNTAEIFDQSANWKKKPKDWGADPEDAFEQKEFWTTLHRAIDALPNRMAEAYKMRELDRQSTEEICEILDITPTNLGVLLFRARTRLRDALGTEWFGIQRN